MTNTKHIAYDVLGQLYACVIISKKIISDEKFEKS